MTASRSFTVFFEPNDVVLFRDHRPFDMGAHALAKGRFPPPSTAYGCLRTALVRVLDPDFFRYQRSALEVAQKLGDIRPRVRGPFTARFVTEGERPRSVDPLAVNRVELFHTVPFDVAGLSASMSVDHADRARARPEVAPSGRFLDRATLLGRKTSRPARLIPVRPGEPPKREARRLLTASGVDWWRAPHQAGAGLTIDEGGAFQEEDRVGIARSVKRLAHIDGMFYIARYTRMAPEHGYAVELTVEATTAAERAVRQLDGQFVRLGGKGRTARLYVAPGSCLPDRWGQLPGARARLTLLTPAKASVLQGDALALPGGAATVETLMTDTGAIPAGGWDFAQRAPKPLEPVLPAGTVFFCRFDSNAPAGVIRSVGHNPSDHHAGFGAVAVGEWRDA